MIRTAMIILKRLMSKTTLKIMARPTKIRTKPQKKPGAIFIK
jgi:hypothetical protein